jgi:hypothetical protein
MAGNVTGSIGNEEVVLNNAATESTLAALLRTAQGDSAVLKALAAKAGVDAAAIAAVESASQGAAEGLEDVSGASVLADNGLQALNRRIAISDKIFGELNEAFNKAINGSLQSSDVFSSLSKIPGPAGIVASGLMRVAQFQEENMKMYQQISSVGANFGGSLTQMRLAAAGTSMDLQQFGAMITKNSETLAMLGGGVDAGTKNFARLSKELMSSDAGRYLQSLGMTTEQVNQGMLSYISMTGGRSTQELNNTKNLTNSAAEYMTQLDGLARLTGKSKEAQQAELDAASKNAAFQAQLQGMSEEQRAKAVAGMANALALGGKGAVDAFQSKLMGIAPDKAGQMFIATAGEMANVIDKSAGMVTDGSKNVKDMSGTMKEGMRAAQADMGKYSKETLFAIIRAGGPLADSLQQMGITANRANQLTDKEIETALKKVELDKSEAEAMAAANKGLKDLGAALIGIISPVVSLLTPVFGLLGKVLSSFASSIDKLPETGKMIVSVLATIGAGYLAYSLMQKKKLAEEIATGTAKRIVGGAGAPSGGGAGALGELGKVGGGIGPVLEGLAAGLKSFANPLVLAGAVGLAAALGIIITGVGAGIAAASYLIGKSLPTMAEGLDSFSKINGSNLVDVSKGIGALGLAMTAFGAGSAVGAVGAGISSLVGGVSKLFGGNDVMGQITKSVQQFTPVLPQLTALGPAIQSYASGLASFGTAINSINITKAEQVRALLAKPMPAAPIAASGAALTASAAALNATSGSGENKASDVDALNKTMMEVLKYIKDTAENTKRTHEATRSLNGNMFAT